MFKARNIFLCFVCVCLSLSYTMFVFAKNGNGNSTLSDGERALAMLEVQNTMSKHAYYHAAGLHEDELYDIWVDPDGEYATTAKWSNPMGVWEGWDTIYTAYVLGKLETSQAALDVISSLYPEIENTPENLGIGTEWAMHTQTTPIIEIADDGKTAKGIWYSPGIAYGAVIKDDGTVGTSGMWFWEKYGADFVKEDGEWRLWHIQMYYDNTPESWGDEGEAIGSGGGSDYSYDNPDPYEAWSPTTLQRIHPQFPEPYSTFSETFSY